MRAYEIIVHTPYGTKRMAALGAVMADLWVDEVEDRWGKHCILSILRNDMPITKADLKADLQLEVSARRQTHMPRPKPSP